jgi:hypothetical protein
MNLTAEKISYTLMKREKNKWRKRHGKKTEYPGNSPRGLHRLLLYLQQNHRNQKGTGNPPVLRKGNGNY